MLLLSPNSQKPHLSVCTQPAQKGRGGCRGLRAKQDFLCLQFISIKDKRKQLQYLILMLSFIVEFSCHKKCMFKVSFRSYSPIKSCNQVTRNNETPSTNYSKMRFFLFYYNHQIVCLEVLMELYINLMCCWKTNK